MQLLIWSQNSGGRIVRSLQITVKHTCRYGSLDKFPRQIHPGHSPCGHLLSFRPFPSLNLQRGRLSFTAHSSQCLLHVVRVIGCCGMECQECLPSVFTALHVMQTRYCDEISVCPSVRSSVCPSVRLSHACIVTKR